MSQQLMSFPLVGNPSEKLSERFRPSRNDKLAADTLHLWTYWTM